MGLRSCTNAGHPAPLLLRHGKVLEQEAKKGLPSRAEITDAAQSQRADCVMLNKGPHILAAIHTLDSILRGMQSLYFRKTS